MSEIGSRGTSYPSELPSNNEPEQDKVAANRSRMNADLINDIKDLLVNICTELGVDVAGNYTNLVDRLAYNLDGVERTSGPATVSVVLRTTFATSTGTGDAITLPDGSYDGQIKTIVYSAETAGADTLVITPTNLIGETTVTLEDIGEAANFVWDDTVGSWAVAFHQGATIA